MTVPPPPYGPPRGHVPGPPPHPGSRATPPAFGPPPAHRSSTALLTTGRVLSWTAFAIFTVFLLVCAVGFVLLVVGVVAYPDPMVLVGMVFGGMLLVVGLPPLFAYAVDALLGAFFPYLGWTLSSLTVGLIALVALLFSESEFFWARVVIGILLLGAVCGLTGTVLRVIDRVTNADAYVFEKWQKQERKRPARAR